MSRNFQLDTARLCGTTLLAAILTACAPQSNTSSGGASSSSSGSGTAARVSDAASAEMTAVLESHNRYRGIHGAAPLTWSASLAATAQDWADQCSFTHSGDSRSGENLMLWTGSRAPVELVDVWYAENAGYDYASGGPNSSGAVTGHFTQMVWKGSTQLGCGVATCPSQGNLMVCQYVRPGNVLGRYTENVSPPR